MTPTDAASERLIRVVAPHFVAGFITDGAVTIAAPILKYMIGWSDDRARSYIATKGWVAHVVRSPAGDHHDA
jgi:hypothetical protein